MRDARPRRHIFGNPVASLLGGLVLAGIAAGIVVLILVLVVEPLSKPGTRDMVSHRSTNFRIWIRKGSPKRGRHEDLALTLEEELEALIELLEVERDRIPTPIDVFIHDDIPALQDAILLRKGEKARAVYHAPLDLLESEEPRSRLAELVLAYGWGRSGSQILQIGVTQYAAEPERNFHAIIAALPDRLFLTLPDLILLEKRRRLPQSLYQRYDAPYSPAMIGSLVDLKDLFELSENGEEQPNDLPVLEAASFVQFLIETKGGIRVLKQAWGTGTTEQLLERIDPASPMRLGTAWVEATMERGKKSPDFPYLRAYYLLESGDPDTAWAEMSEWPTGNLSEQELCLIGRCALIVEGFAEAKRLVDQLSREETPAKLRDFLAFYEGWVVGETARLRVLVPETLRGSLQELVTTCEQAYSLLITRLELLQENLPQRLTLFLYPDIASRDRGASLTTSFLATQSAILHVLWIDDFAYSLAEILPAYAWRKETYSRLLRAGLAVALSRPKEHLLEQGCQLWRDGQWVSLSVLDFGAANRETVEVEAGLLAHFLLETFGAQVVREIWISTSPFDRYLSVDTALEEICGTNREQIETFLFSSFLNCN